MTRLLLRLEAQLCLSRVVTWGRYGRRRQTYFSARRIDGIHTCHLDITFENCHVFAMRCVRLTPLLYVVVAACSSADVSGIFSEDHIPLRSPCQATDLPMQLTLKLVCPTGPVDPRTLDPEFWTTARPIRSRLASLDGDEISTVEYDFDSPYMYPHATYRSDENLESVSFPDQTPNTNTEFKFSYDGSTWVGAHAATEMGVEADTEVLYQDGKRHWVGLTNSAMKAGHHFRYDDSGRIVAKIGGGTIGILPERPEASMLDTVCNGALVPVFEGSLQPGDPVPVMGASYYFRDDDGRITTAIHGWLPATPFYKQTYQYDAEDRLVSVTTECGANSTQVQDNNTRRTYEY